MYLDTMNSRMLIESSSKNFDLPVNVIRFSSPAGTRTSKILKNTNYKLRDKYVVGASKLQVYIDDILCCIGTEYNEIGLEGEESDTIQFIDWDVDINRNLEYVIIGKDYLTISVNGDKVAKVDNNIDLKIPTKTSDLVNDAAFLQYGGTISNSDNAAKTTGTLTIQKNGTLINTFNGSTNITANITVPVKSTELSDTGLIVYSKDDTVSDIRMISEASYNALDKSTIPNGTVYLVY